MTQKPLDLESIRALGNMMGYDSPYRPAFYALMFEVERLRVGLVEILTAHGVVRSIHTNIGMVTCECTGCVRARTLLEKE